MAQDRAPDTQVKLYWAPRSRALRAVWMLEEANVDYERVVVDIDAPDRDPEFLAVSPMGKVPALVDGALKTWESAAICLHLADRYAPGRLAPAGGSANRGRYLQWMFFVPGVVEPATAERLAGRLSVARVNGWGDFDQMIDSWKRGLCDDCWALGDRFSAADVMLGSAALWMRKAGVLPKSETLSAYVDRCLTREALKRALALDNES